MVYSSGGDGNSDGDVKGSGVDGGNW